MDGFRRALCRRWTANFPGSDGIFERCDRAESDVHWPEDLSKRLLQDAREAPPMRCPHLAAPWLFGALCVMTLVVLLENVKDDEGHADLHHGVRTDFYADHHAELQENAETSRCRDRAESVTREIIREICQTV